MPVLFSNRLLIFTFLISFLMSCTPPAPTITRIDGSQIDSLQLTRQIQSLMDSAEVTGMVISIFNHNESVYQEAFGLADADKGDSLRTAHLFYAASFSKAVFGYLVAQLVDEGQLDLDKPLQEYLDQPLPDIPFEKDWRSYTDLKDDPRYKQITARMCLNHTTGFPNWRWLTRDFDFDPDGKIQILFDPGTRFSYSGEGMNLLQFVVEQISGKGLEELAQERIFQPLGMTMTSYIWQERFEETYCLGHRADQSLISKDPNDEAGAAGSMETTIEDYSRFVQHIMTLVQDSSSVTRLMFEPQVRIRSRHQFGATSWEDTDANDDITLSYGLGWGLLQSPHGWGAFKEGHDNGFQHYSILFPEQQTGIILMCNSDNGESIFKYVLETAIGDVYTPWEWERYIPFDMKK